MSKETLVTASQVPGEASRPSGFHPAGRSAASMPAKKLTALPWLTTTPLGRPVEPDV
jgi:hypothetical protein